MGFRFRRSIKIFPGIRLNLGTRGVSTSIGVRGAHITLGKSGVRTTVGVPGSGLSYTHLHKPGHRTAMVESPPPEQGTAPGLPRRGSVWLWLVSAALLVGFSELTRIGSSQPTVEVQAAPTLATAPNTPAIEVAHAAEVTQATGVKTHQRHGVNDAKSLHAERRRARRQRAAETATARVASERSSD